MALDKIIAKLERHQNPNGTWAMDGWAPVVGQSLASAGLNRARQRGAKVADETLERAEKYARSSYDAGSNTYSDEGSAGVPLYSLGSHLSSSSHSVYNFKAMKAHLRKAAERTVRGLYRTIRRFVPQIRPRECANYFRHAGYASN